MDQMLETIVTHTNIKIEIAKQKYAVQSHTTSNTNIDEIKALIEIYIISTALKDNHLSSDIMFDTNMCGKRYRATMSQKRFDFLTCCLRFDNKATRTERKELIAIWEDFIDICRKSYKPSEYVCIYEQLVGFRGKCPFRMYIPNKPNKYGIKFDMLCDVATKYMIDAYPYRGKSTDTVGLSLSEFSVINLTKTIHGTHRNVTMDNWFTSIPLAEKLYKKPYQLTVVGTLRPKPQVPLHFHNKNDKNRQVSTSLFAFSPTNLSLLSYKPKQNKIVLLLSSMHPTMVINETSGKPKEQLILLTKCVKICVVIGKQNDGHVDISRECCSTLFGFHEGVTLCSYVPKKNKAVILLSTMHSDAAVNDDNTMDQMVTRYTTQRPTQRWPLAMFFNILDVGALASYIIYYENNKMIRKKTNQRRIFLRQLGEELAKPFIEESVIGPQAGPSTIPERQAQPRDSTGRKKIM
ncbi:hypothetical protein NQ318_012465, partial [Aromia moschata]